MGRRPGEAADEQFIGAAVTAERRALCELLDQLAPEEWLAQSLCDGWTIRDVVAHLTLVTRETRWEFFSNVIRARGNFDRMNAETARATARQFSPSELVERLRATADSNRRAPMSDAVDPLIDILVHGQDITQPLGRSHPMPPRHVLPALDRAVTSHWYGSKKRFDGVTLVATDIPWQWGSGSREVRGTAGELLMIAMGRNIERLGVGSPSR